MHRFKDDGKVNDIPGHSVPLAGLGGFILIFGFLAFNGGSQVKDYSSLILWLISSSLSLSGKKGIKYLTLFHVRIV